MNDIDIKTKGMTLFLDSNNDVRYEKDACVVGGPTTPIFCVVKWTNDGTKQSNLRVSKGLYSWIGSKMNSRSTACFEDPYIVPVHILLVTLPRRNATCNRFDRRNHIITGIAINYKRQHQYKAYIKRKLNDDESESSKSRGR